MAKFPLLCALLGAVSLSPALAQGDDPPEREVRLEVYGDDPCPPSVGDDIVVCARRPEEERYRIPAPLRRSSRPAEAAWGARAETLEEVSRDARPNSCSVVGSYGQTGCTQQMIRQWYEERRSRQR